MIDTNKWNIKRKEIDKFFKLKNGQWLKIKFIYTSSLNKWGMDIVVANSKRQCNDCLRKTEFSPKILYGKRTGNKTGIEPFAIALRELLNFEKTVYNCEIRIIGASEKLTNIYKRLTKYGYNIKTITYSNGRNKDIVYKNIK